MHLISMLLFLLLAFSAHTTLACKCLDGGGVNDERSTYVCCNIVGSHAVDHDCPAKRISNKLSNFHSCCKGNALKSDCRCPKDC